MTHLLDRQGALTERILGLAGQGHLGTELARRDAALRANYDSWSRGYDSRNAPTNYLVPQQLAKLAQAYLPSSVGPILDAACGTGLLGEALGQAGFRELVGTDVSPAMLSRAKEKGVYLSLHEASLHCPLPFLPGSFAAVTCSGSFYPGLVEVMALAHLLPLLRPGGHLLCDVEPGAWHEGGFRQVLAGLEQDGWLRVLHSEPIRIYCPGHLGPEDDPEAPQCMAILARMEPN